MIFVQPNAPATSWTFTPLTNSRLLESGKVFQRLEGWHLMETYRLDDLPTKARLLKELEDEDDEE